MHCENTKKTVLSLCKNVLPGLITFWSAILNAKSARRSASHSLTIYPRAPCFPALTDWPISTWGQGKMLSSSYRSLLSSSPPSSTIYCPFRTQIFHNAELRSVALAERIAALGTRVEESSDVTNMRSALFSSVI